jgi:geranylgeranyl diphosphate synthase, type I
MSIAPPAKTQSDAAARGDAAPAAAQVLAEAQALVEPAYRAVVAALPEPLRQVTGYHVGWWDRTGRPASGTGKAVRPALVLACARAAVVGEPGEPGALARAGDRAVSIAQARAMPAAVAVELVHDFSLLHDDVMDRDLTRRGRPAAWTVYGVSQAILTGDALLTAAMLQLAGTAGPGDVRAAGVGVLASTVSALCAGQAADLTFEDQCDITMADCLAMARDKTGALLGAAAQLGAMAGGADRGTASCYRMFGRQLGIAFQLIDDLLGIWGDPAVTGKPAGADLTVRKKSLPVVAALTSGTAAADRLRQLYQQGRDLAPEEVVVAAQLVEAAGGRSWARAEAARRTQSALDALNRARPGPVAAAELRALAALLARRDH